MRYPRASLHIFHCRHLTHCPAQIIRNSLPFFTYYQHASNPQPLNPLHHPPSSIYHYEQAPHISTFLFIQTRESIPTKNAGVCQVENNPESTPNNENQIAMLSRERWIARKPEKKTCDSKPDCKKQKQRRLSSAKKQITPTFELEIKDVKIEVCESCVLQIRNDVELYESSGQIYSRRAQLDFSKAFIY